MCFDICTINIRVSIRVRGLHLVSSWSWHEIYKYICRAKITPPMGRSVDFLGTLEGWHKVEIFLCILVGGWAYLSEKYASVVISSIKHPINQPLANHLKCLYVFIMRLSMGKPLESPFVTMGSLRSHGRLWMMFRGGTPLGKSPNHQLKWWWSLCLVNQQKNMAPKCSKSS